MRPLKASKADPRFAEAAQMFDQGASLTQIAVQLRIRRETVALWFAHRKPRAADVQIAPEPFARGYRWFGAKWH